MLQVAANYSAVLREVYADAPDRRDGPGPNRGWNIALTTWLRFGERGITSYAVPLFAVPPPADSLPAF
jgi:hypothetical protein